MDRVMERLHVEQSVLSFLINGATISLKNGVRCTDSVRALWTYWIQFIREKKNAVWFQVAEVRHIIDEMELHVSTYFGDSSCVMSDSHTIHLYLLAELSAVWWKSSTSLVHSRRSGQMSAFIYRLIRLIEARGMKICVDLWFRRASIRWWTLDWCIIETMKFSSRNFFECFVQHRGS